MMMWVSVTVWISAGITTHHVNTLRITLSYVIYNCTLFGWTDSHLHR